LHVVDLTRTDTIHHIGNNDSYALRRELEAEGKSASKDRGLSPMRCDVARHAWWPLLVMQPGGLHDRGPADDGAGCRHGRGRCFAL